MISSNSSLLYATPPPEPPSVNAGRMIAGRPISRRNSRACSSVVTVRARAIFRPIASHNSLNAWRSSARWIAARSAPIMRMSYCWNVPSSHRAQAQFSAVCPPSVGSTASIGSPISICFWMILRTASGVIGSMYVRSENSGSVMIVAGLELTSTTRYPSARSALHACVPE